MVRTSKNIVWEEVGKGEHSRTCLSVYLSIQVSCLTLLLPRVKLVKTDQSVAWPWTWSWGLKETLFEFSFYWLVRADHHMKAAGGWSTSKKRPKIDPQSVGCLRVCLLSDYFHTTRVFTGYFGLIILPFLKARWLAFVCYSLLVFETEFVMRRFNSVKI